MIVPRSCLGRHVGAGWRKSQTEVISESIYFVLCVIKVNTELRVALSPMGIGDAALTPTFIELQGYILRGITLHCYGSRWEVQKQIKFLTKINLWKIFKYVHFSHGFLSSPCIKQGVAFYLTCNNEPRICLEIWTCILCFLWFCEKFLYQKEIMKNVV